MKRLIPLTVLVFLMTCSVFSQGGRPAYSRHDSLSGSNTPQRGWWDVQRYDVEVTPDFATKTITGRTKITYRVLPNRQSDYLQVDLQQPLEIDSVFYNGKLYINDPGRPYYRDGNHWFIPLPKTAAGTTQSLTVVYHGKPKEAKNAPWEGGWVWARDQKGRPWISVACEDDGASVWFPCKDFWDDEPDKGASLKITVADSLVAVGNGRLKTKTSAGGKTTFQWEVTAPINAYNIVPYIGHYTMWSDTLLGEKGNLDLNYWVLDYDRSKAKKQFEQVKPTLRAFEHWFGPYPFYGDGYKLVQAPYLGMEHQSAVAYGNQFKNGYMGSDLSGTGWGLKWDYIIVHESGHEWFGNSLTASDKADMWVHEGFTDYSEPLFIEFYYGRDAANEYVQGLRRNIQNDRPLIGDYGVNREGSGDMYFKGANLLHTIRQLIGDDSLFRQILRGLNREFYHQTVSSKQVETYIIRQSGKDLQKEFDQYLRTARVPVLEYRQTGNSIHYRWANTVAGFRMPVRLRGGRWLKPKESWQTLQLPDGEAFSIDKNFYVDLRKL